VFVKEGLGGGEGDEGCPEAVSAAILESSRRCFFFSFRDLNGVAITAGDTPFTFTGALLSLGLLSLAEPSSGTEPALPLCAASLAGNVVNRGAVDTVVGLESKLVLAEAVYSCKLPDSVLRGPRRACARLALADIAAKVR
jgi:hypothetical protein